MEEDSSNGSIYDGYAQCELLIERLKLLDYENELVTFSDSLKTIPRHYFVNSTNTGEQFYLFTSIAAWLIRKAGIDENMTMPGEFDDPNETIANIVEILKIKGVEIGFPLAKLLSGSDSNCIFILLKLSEFAIESANARIDELISLDSLHGDPYHQEEEQTDEAEITADQFDIEEDIALEEENDDNDENEEDRNGNGIHQESDIIEPLKGALNCYTDIRTMQEELQHVLPQLKVTIRSNFKNWRIHTEQMKKYEDAVDKQLAEIESRLGKNIEEVANALERIQSRENHLNTTFSSLLNAYGQKKNAFVLQMEQYKEKMGVLDELNGTLNNLTKESEQLTQEIEEQSAQKTSGAPILKVKQAINHLENEIFALRVQIAATEQILMQSQLADRVNNAADYF